MPVFDILGFMKVASRFLILAGIITYVIGFSFVMAFTANEIAKIFSMSIIKFNGLLDGGGGGSSISCLFTLFSDLGFDVAFNSFASTVVGLLLLYAGILIELHIMKFGLFLKGLLLTGTK